MRQLLPLFLVPAVLTLSACGADQPEPTDQGHRNVVVRVMKPEPMSVDIRLPVVLYPFRELELRASAGGRIVSMPYEEGDIVPASVLPDSRWIDESAFVAASNPASEDSIALRHLRHLADVRCFARIDSAQLVQGVRELQAEHDQAVRDLIRLEGYPQTTGAQLDQARTRRATTRAAVERTLAMVHDTYVCSPVQGVLVERVRHEGEFVSPGELLGRIAVLDPLLAKLELPEAHHRVLKVDDRIDVAFEALRDADGRPEVHQARVRRVDRVAHPQTHTFTVELEITNPDLLLPAGIFGVVSVTIYSNPEAMVVPLSAVKLAGETRSLFVVGDGGRVTELREIALGRMTSNSIEVRDDRVTEGMKIVTIGAQWLTHGDTVSWTETDPILKR